MKKTYTRIYKSKANDIMNNHDILGVEIIECSKLIEKKYFNDQPGLSPVGLDYIKKGLPTRNLTKLKFTRSLNFLLKNKGADAQYSLNEIFEIN